MRASITIASLISAIVFPWSFACAAALAAAFFVPLAPLACGLLADALYYAPHAYPFPLYTVLGAFASAAALLVRRFVETSIMRR